MGRGEQNQKGLYAIEGYALFVRVGKNTSNVSYCFDCNNALVSATVFGNLSSLNR
jgi:hypothetical protein